jgi:hypothetical protein
VRMQMGRRLEAGVNLWIVRTSRSMHLHMGWRVRIRHWHRRVGRMAHVWRGVWVTLWWLWWLRVSGRGLRSKLECCGNAGTIRVANVNALPSAYFIKVIEVETLDVSLK